MQDVQNIPNPDVDSFENKDDFGSHSDIHPDPRTDSDSQNPDVERSGVDIPVPPDSQQNVRIEDPPDERDKPPIDEDSTEPRRLV